MSHCDGWCVPILDGSRQLIDFNACDLSTGKIKRPKKEGMQGIAIYNRGNKCFIGGLWWAVEDGLVVMYSMAVLRVYKHDQSRKVTDL